MSVDFWEFGRQFGLPVAMLISAIVLGRTRVWVYGWQLAENEATWRSRYAEMLLQWEGRLKQADESWAERHADTIKGYERRLTECQATAARYERMFLSLAGTLNEAMASLQKVST